MTQARRRAGQPVVVATTVAETAELFCGPLITALRDQGDSVVVVTTTDPRSLTDALIHDSRVEVIRMRRDPSPIHDLRGLVQWVVLLARLRPRAVIVLTPKASLLGMVAARLTRVPMRIYLLVGLRLEGATGVMSIALGLAERLTSACATKVVANSPSLASAYLHRRLCAEHRLVFTNPGSDHGVDVHHFDPTHPPVSDAPWQRQCVGRVVIGYVGRLTEDKGISTLTHALRDPRLRGRVALLVVGAAEDQVSVAAIRALADSDIPVHVQEHVQDIRPWYSLMQVLVLPTRREGFPNVVLEAAAMGIPSVTTTATGAVDSVVNDRTGLLVPIDAPAALADALVRLVADPALRERMGVAARVRTEQHFRPEAVVASLLSMTGLVRSP